MQTFVNNSVDCMQAHNHSVTSGLSIFFCLHCVTVIMRLSVSHKLQPSFSNEFTKRKRTQNVAAPARSFR